MSLDDVRSRFISFPFVSFCFSGPVDAMGVDLRSRINSLLRFEEHLCWFCEYLCFIERRYAAVNKVNLGSVSKAVFLLD